MKKLEIAKLIIGFIFIGFSLLGVIGILFYNNLDHWAYVNYFGADGVSTSIPVFCGLSAIAGTMLINSVK